MNKAEKYLPVTFLLFLFAWAVFNLFLFNHSISLWDQDESAYAGFALVMIETGNWVIPDFMWSEVHRKTPLHFWSIAVSYLIFGVNEFSVRFPGALAIMLTWLMTFYWGKAVFGKQAALIGACLLATSLFLPNLGKISVTDAVLLCWQAMSALALIRFMEKPDFKWLLFFWIGIAGGVLTKGPPVLLLTAGMSGILLLFHPQRMRLFKLHPWFFLPLSLLPLFIWGRFAWQYDDGDFVMWMLDWYILDRAKGGTAFGQTGPPGYFFGLFALSILPFLSVFLLSLMTMFKKSIRLKSRDKYYLYFIAWFIPAWFIYELIPSKLPSYAIAALPGICLMAGYYISQQDFIQKFHTKSFRIIGIIAFLISVGLAVGMIYAIYDLTAHLGMRYILLIIMFLIWITLMAIQLKALLSGNISQWLKLGLIAGLMFIFSGWGFAVPLLEDDRSATKQAALYIAENEVEIKKVLISIEYPLPSLPFYLHREDISYQDVQYDDHQVIWATETQEKHAWIITEKVWQQWNHSNWFDDYKNQIHHVQLDGWISDRGQWEKYHVVFKR